LAEVERGAASLRAAVGSAQEQLGRLEAEAREGSRSMGLVLRGGDDVAARIDALAQQITVMQTRQTCNTRVKGTTGETRLYELLCERLTTREDYEVEQVNGQAHNCDLLVRRLGHPDVRIESKAHGEQTGEKVRAKEVMRFRSDLLGLGSHGVFVSLHSGIVGKGEVELEQLSNGRFAVYLSNNGYDVGIIHDMLRVVYQLDALTGNADVAGECPSGQSAAIRVGADVMRRVQLHLQDFGGKVALVKQHMKESVALLNELTFDRVELLLMGAGGAAGPGKPATTSVPGIPGGADGAREAPGEGARCEDCGKPFKNAVGLARHRRAMHAPSRGL
jgi:hypothetical protein